MGLVDCRVSKAHLGLKASPDGLGGTVLLEKEAHKVWWDRKDPWVETVEMAHQVCQVETVITDATDVTVVLGMTVHQAYPDETAEMDVTVQQDSQDEMGGTAGRDGRESEELRGNLDLVVNAEKLANKEIKDNKDVTGVQAHKAHKARKGSQGLQVNCSQCQKDPGLPQESRSWWYVNSVV